MRKLVTMFAVVVGLGAGSLGCGDKKSGPTGNAVCDTYIKKASACADKLGDGGATLKRSVATKTQMWTERAKSSDKMQRDMLPDFCEMEANQAKQDHPDCSW